MFRLFTKLKDNAKGVIFSRDNYINFVLVVFFLFLLAIILKHLKIITIDRDKLLDYFDKITHKQKKIIYPMVTITDRENQVYAISIKRARIYFRPKYIYDPDKFGELLKKHLNISKEYFEKVFAKNINSSFMILLDTHEYNPYAIWSNVTKINRSYLSYLKEVGFSPHYKDLISLDSDHNFTYKRLYPLTVPMDLIGFINEAGDATSFHLWLKHHNLLKKKVVNLDYFVFGKQSSLNLTKLEESLKPYNSTVVTTVDAKLTYVFYEILKKYYKKFKPKLIMAGLMDVNTGDILTLVKYPSITYDEFFKLNKNKKNLKRINKLLTPDYVTNAYELGSVFKPFVVAAAINEGLVKPNSIIYCPLSIKVQNKVFKTDSRWWPGYLRVWQIIAHSDNVGIIKIAQKLGKERYYTYLKKFGFGQKTTIELPGETTGILRPWQMWKDVEFATMTFGHGISASFVQLLQAYAALVNGGYLIHPRLVKAILDNRGNIVYKFPIKKKGKVISKWTSLKMRKILTGVVEHGTAQAAKFKQYYIAGKTGTAWKIVNGKYSREKIIATFVAAFPATKPKFVLAVLVDEPQVNETMAWSSKIAVPIFKELAEKVIVKYKLKPDKVKCYLTKTGKVKCRSIKYYKTKTFHYSNAKWKPPKWYLEKLKKARENKVNNQENLTSN
ncbi:MAG TPA: penicillin-binding protein 2 [Desulfurobacteriaceae bacterium]|nr:penicillin-binding protein 2 [Desulfurobacteriaceae bacterium]